MSRPPSNLGTVKWCLGHWLVYPLDISQRILDVLPTHRVALIHFSHLLQLRRLQAQKNCRPFNIDRCVRCTETFSPTTSTGNGFFRSFTIFLNSSRLMRFSFAIPHRKPSAEWCVRLSPSSSALRFVFSSQPEIHFPYAC